MKPENFAFLLLFRRREGMLTRCFISFHPVWHGIMQEKIEIMRRQ